MQILHFYLFLFSNIYLPIFHIFHYHVNIISKLMTEFVSELVEFVHSLYIVTNFNVQAMQS